MCYLHSANSDATLRQVADLCAVLDARLSVVMPVIDTAIPDGCCGIQGEHWRRLTDEDSRDAMRRAVALLDSPARQRGDRGGPSVPETARRAAARCACDVTAVSAKRYPWSSAGLSRRQLKRLRRAAPREVVELVP
jgi:hypothetical protein